MAAFLYSLFLFPLAIGAMPIISVRHPAPALPASWKRLSHPVVDDYPVTLHLSLQQSRLEELYATARRVSDPGSPAYGQYLTRSEVMALTAPQKTTIDTVERWLNEAGIRFTRRNELVRATLTASDASDLLHTQFHHVGSKTTAQATTRAGDFSLPKKIHDSISAIYGLHGLPLPPKGGIPSSHQIHPASIGPRKEVNVTPALIRHTYNVSGVVASGSLKNRQAVAEFGGQTMGPSDLEEFFQKYVPNAANTSASKIHHFVGSAGPTLKAPGIFGEGWGVEASLDVDCIMGSAPGVLTEFWYYSSTDFCADLKNWTAGIVSSELPPVVHSLSYGYQGNVSDIGCERAALDVDADLAKLAARGITVVISSGDSGSGYVKPVKCSPTSATLQDTTVVGTLKSLQPAMEATECCDKFIDEPDVIAWAYTPPPVQGGMCKRGNGTAYEGKVYREESTLSEDECCTSALSYESAGYTYLPANRTAKYATCRYFTTITGSTTHPTATSGSTELGSCRGYTAVSATAPAKGGVSGGEGIVPEVVKVWPSWPASSPWVTAVGGTRFENEDTTLPEVATQLFGSGGGFSSTWPAFPSQAAATAHYLSNTPGLPPKGSFPPEGRATPDVAALGEGYQIIANGLVETVGGTSASAPTFAALVSLLNEKRIEAGLPVMGHLNPFLYENPGMFHDITQGHNAIGRDGPLDYGFNCTVGWDPVTGLGTPMFDKMLAAALSVNHTTA